MKTKRKIIKCHHCGYLWRTKSKNLYVPCPKCMYKVRNIKLFPFEKSNKKMLKKIKEELK